MGLIDDITALAKEVSETDGFFPYDEYIERQAYERGFFAGFKYGVAAQYILDEIAETEVDEVNEQL